jgi:anti-anti-sigma regulatory factor
VCDVGALVGRPDAGTIDALAHLQLTLRRDGLELVLRGASEELLELLVLVGLADVLGVEPWRQAEEREQRVGLEEEGEPDDPPL